tara:strand:+ start:445 stop:1044 length:600 start_codon:yes stop_codon:yes gene_type:complete
MNKIILIGAGGHARSCIDIIELSGKFRIVGLVERDNAVIQENLGYPIIGSDKDLQILRQKYEYALVTVGQIKSPVTRIKIFQQLQKLEFKLPVIQSPRAYVSKHSKIGNGTIISHDVIVNANVKIGENCIINNRALIEHDAVVCDHCHIATGAIINGEVKVCSESFVGSGVITKQSITIGSKSFIRAGLTIKHDFKSNE